MKLGQFLALGPVLLGLALAPRSALAIALDDPINFQLINTWSGATFGVPGRLGAMMFSADGQTLYVVGNSEAASSAVYALPVTRDPATQRVTGFGNGVLVFSGNPATPGIDAGLEIGPDGTLFYTYWRSHYLGERAATSTAVEQAFSMAATGVPSSVAGLTFSPLLFDPGSGFRLLQVSSWLGNGVYNVPLSPLGGGIYQPGTAELFVSLPQQGTGAIQYVPQGLYAGNMMYVNWNYGEVRMVVVDKSTGYPIDDTTGLPALGTSTPRDIRFAYDMGVGPWGLEFDPRTLDFFVSTWAGNPGDSIVQFSGPGFRNRPPVAYDQTVTTLRDTAVTITLTATDAERSPLTFSVVSAPSHGTLSGTTADVLYTPSAGYVGPDFFTFRASDGRDNSNTATVTLAVVDVAPLDAGGEDSALDAGSAQDATAAADAAPGRDATAAADASGAADANGGPAADASGGGNDSGGCGCATTDRPRGSMLALLFVAALIALRRRRGT
ncbi:MAG: cadherin-like domain-containing protein [Deltaproteobacteria bacterium]|nr:cadherin-like domain-containing protein [Deltaproteobacteria bacterium]